VISKKCLDVWVWSGILAELMLPVQTEIFFKKTRLASPFRSMKCVSGSTFGLVRHNRQIYSNYGIYEDNIRIRKGWCLLYASKARTPIKRQKKCVSILAYLIEVIGINRWRCPNHTKQSQKKELYIKRIL
jgi:hypothetical protein